MNKLTKTLAVAMLGASLTFGTTACSFFPNPDISNVNLELSEKKQLQQLFKDSAVQIAKDGGIFRVVDKNYTMSVAYDNTYIPYDIVFYSDGKLINVGSTASEDFKADPLAVFGATLFEYGDYTFSRKDNVYTLKENNGNGVVVVTIKNNLVQNIHSEDSGVVYEIRVEYKIDDEATFFFDKVNKDALNNRQSVPEATEAPIDLGTSGAEEVPTPTQ